MIKSVYIHIPFCKSICTYCDFCKMYYNKLWIKDYLNALEYEIDTYYKGEVLDTIYIGGGTPSCLDIDELEHLLKIIEKIKTSKNLEYTIEVNPEDIEIDKIELLNKYGVNRISIGIESINENILKIMNRKNNTIKEKINLVKKYIKNINVDLIYGFKEETLDILNKDLDFLLSLDITHISTYSLILEEHTVLYNKKYKNIDEDTDLLFYNTIRKKLKENNFNQYEISNFSKKGYESRHNLTYWNNQEYYGFGLGASGYIDNIRYTNTKNITKYNKLQLSREHEELSLRDKKIYHIILGLRLLKGVNKKEYKKIYNSTIEEDFKIDHLLKKKYLINEDNYIKINPKYLYQENQILLEFMD